MQLFSAVSSRPRVACFTPLPPQKTGIATYASGVLPLLASELEMDVFVDQRRVDCPEITSSLTVRHLLRFPLEAERYDVLLYEMGNSSAHAGIYELALHYPGIVHLHDLVLHHFYLDYYFHRGRAREYRWKLRRMQGSEGAVLGKCVAHDFGGSLGYFELPMRNEIVRRALGVVVHSHWARQALRRDFPSLPILRIDMPCFEPRVGETNGLAFRQRLGIPTDAFVVTSLGFATPSKRIDRLLEALARVRFEVPSIRLLVVGELNPASGLEERAAALGVADLMIATGYVHDRDLWDALAASDVVASLRFPTAGETSAPLMQALTIGKPALVSGFRQFLELPESACVRIPLGEQEIPALARAILELSRDPERRRRMEHSARTFAASRGSPDRAARALAGFCRVLAPLSRLQLRRARASIREARLRAASALRRRSLWPLSARVSGGNLEAASAASWVAGTDEAGSCER